jgi:methyl-accepting chemotaxis protein
MSERDSPVEMLFEVQRETIRQTEDVIENVLELSTEFGENVAGGVDAHQEIQEQTLELSRESMHRSLDAAEAVATTSASVEAVPDQTANLDELRAMVDDTFERIQDQQAEVFDSVDRQYDEISDGAIENLGSQIDLLVQFNERIETQLLETVEELIEQAEQTDELTGALDDHLERLGDQFEAQAERFGDLERQFESIELGDD